MTLAPIAAASPRSTFSRSRASIHDYLLALDHGTHASFKPIFFDDVDISMEQQFEVSLEAGNVAEAPGAPRSPCDEHIDIAVGTKVGPHRGSKDRKALERMIAGQLLQRPARRSEQRRVEIAKTTSSLEIAMEGPFGEGTLDASFEDPLPADPLSELRLECGALGGITMERDLRSERRCRDLFDRSLKPKPARRGGAFCEHDPGAIAGERGELDVVIRSDEDGRQLLGT